MSRIVLSENEKGLVVGKVFDLMQKNPTMTRLEAFNIAQDVLPPGRRREILHDSWLPDWLKRDLGILRDRLKNKESAPIPRKEFAGVVEKPTQSDVLLLLEMRDLLRGIKAELANIREIVRIAASVAKPAPDISEAQQPPRKRKLKVLVLGMLPVQEEEITKAFGDIFDLSFTKDESRVRDMGRNADRIVAMCSKIGHSMQELARSVNAEAYVPVHGGVSSIKGYLEDLWLESAAN